MKFITMDADDELAIKIKNAADAIGISKFVNIVPRYLAKPLKNNVGAVYKWNDISATLTGSDNTVIVALFGQAFDRVDDETANFWIQSLVSQIEYDFDKDRIVINKDLLTIPLSVYQKYGKVAIDKKELEVHVLNQIAEEEKERKREEKESKKKRS